MTRVLINFCSIEELMSLPGVGAKGADKILEMREAKGDLELEDLSHVPYLTSIVPELIYLYIPLGLVSESCLQLAILVLKPFG
jgi:predicted DNA-binding helix-hairpin-helix protein